METAIRINSDLLTTEILEGIRKMFPQRTVEITILAADDTEYILNNPASRNEIEERIVEYEAKKNVRRALCRSSSKRSSHLLESSSSDKTDSI